jgi:hypothetical protein
MYLGLNRESAFFPHGSSFAPFDHGINFRATSAFVTDGANETYSVAGDTYPVTRGGLTFGWVSGGSTGRVDDDNTLDRRIAGHTYDSSGTDIFKIDGLVAGGVYTIHLGLGDPSGAFGTTGITVKDGTTALITLADAATAAGSTRDATGAIYTHAAWPGSETGVSVTMAGTQITLTFPAAFRPIQHIRIVRTA